MINIRKNIFETNSSSNHNLTIIKDSIYNEWRNHEVVLKIKYRYNSKLDEGDGLFGTWGNFFLEQGNYDYVSIDQQKTKNLEILEPYLSLVITDKFRKCIEEYKLNGKITPPLFIEDLYLTPEEYKESLNYIDCDSPFFYQGNGVVVIGHYSRS